MITVPYNEKTVTWDNLDNWTDEIDAYGRPCKISPGTYAGSGNEVNHGIVTVNFSGTGGVKVGCGYYSTNNLTSMLSSTNNMRGYVAAQSGQPTVIPTCQYRSKAAIWAMIYPEDGVTVESVTLTYWEGINTEYGHAAGGFLFKNQILNYRILFPKNMDNDKTYPLVVSGHGSGGVGSANQRNMEMVILGREMFTRYYHEPDLECISIVPQIPQTVPIGFYPTDMDGLGKAEPMHPDWSAVNENGYYCSAVINLINSLIGDDDNCIDRNRIYYAGFSYGGKAIWELLKQGRRLWAGAISCAGWPIGRAYSNPVGNVVQELRLNQEVARYRHIPTIIAAGGSDSMRYGSTAVYNELISQGANSELQIYPGVSHVSSAGRCWGNKANIDKLFSWKRGRCPRDPYPRKSDGTQYPPL